MFLPDVNLWLALAFESHVHHFAAKHWFDTVARADQSFFCRFTQQGFLRLSTNPKTFPGKAVDFPAAGQMYDALSVDPRVDFLAEPVDLEASWRRLTQSGSYSHKAWSDAYLAAFGQSGGLQVVTFDKGFARFQGVNSRFSPR